MVVVLLSEVVIFLAVLNVGHELSDEGNPGPGHLEPLGSQRPSEGGVEVLTSFPNPTEFYEKYVLPAKPVLIKDGARQIPAFKLWNDAYLDEKYGLESVDIEIGKKEKRSGEGKTIHLRTFLKIYNETDIYMVQDAVDEMKGDLSLPRSLQCGGFQNQMLQAVLWFSSGGTKSVLHNDQPDNLNCIFDGDKELVFIDKKYRDEVEADGWVERGGYSSMDVESVDLNAFPRFKSVPWWSAKMYKGDCLFIPHRWYHTVKSSDSRNLAANLWFIHLMWFNRTDCEQNPAKEHHISLENVNFRGLESIEQLRLELFAFVEGKEEVHLEDIKDVWSQQLEVEDIQQVFGLADTNHDMVLTWDEIYNLDIIQIAQTFPELLGLAEDMFDSEHEDGLHDEL